MLKLLSHGLLLWKNFFRRNRFNIVSESQYHDKEYVKDFVYFWNINFPLDRWYRAKYNIPFNSSNHREISILDIRHEWEEYMLYDKMKESILDPYNPKSESFLKKTEQNIEITEDKIKQWTEEFKQLDLSQYDDE